MKIKDLVFELVDKGKYEFYRGKGIKHDFNLEENKNINPPEWNSGFNRFSSFEEAVKWANAMNLKHFNQEIEKCKQMIKEWEVK